MQYRKNNSELQQETEKESAVSKKQLRKSLLSSGSHFLVQKESKAKYTKLQEDSKQVCAGEVYEEHQMSFEVMAIHNKTLHIQAREFELNKKSSSKRRYIVQSITSVNTKIRYKVPYVTRFGDFADRYSRQSSKMIYYLV